MMRSGGHQLAHIHPLGWMSGVYYAALPPQVADDDPAQAGWIRFGRPGALLADLDGLNCHTIRPQEGLLVLFPSYLYHHTIPFESSERRISIAFDALPKD